MMGSAAQGGAAHVAMRVDAVGVDRLRLARAAADAVESRASHALIGDEVLDIGLDALRRRL